MIYYGSAAIQKSPSQQQSILVNAVRSDDEHDDEGGNVGVTTNQNNEKAENATEEVCIENDEKSNDIKHEEGKTRQDSTDVIRGDILKEENANNVKLSENLKQTEIYDKNETQTPTPASNTTGTQNQTTVPVGSTSGISKIPILQTNLRQAKCASWAGGELNSQQLNSHLSRNSSQGKQSFNINAADIVQFNETPLPTSVTSTTDSKQNVADKSEGGVVFQNPDITDLTPGLLCFHLMCNNNHFFQDIK